MRVPKARAKSFRVFCTETSYDVIISNSMGQLPQVAPPSSERLLPPLTVQTYWSDNRTFERLETKSRTNKNIEANEMEAFETLSMSSKWQKYAVLTRVLHTLNMTFNQDHFYVIDEKIHGHAKFPLSLQSVFDE